MSTPLRVTHVALTSTPDAKAAGRPELTPELLSATGARYSRSIDGLDVILSKVDPNDMDAAVDRIFKFVDYGHASIADMAPVAMFIDGISMWLAYHIWSLVPTAGGQESSTRYIRIANDTLLGTDVTGASDANYAAGAMDIYNAALEFWEQIAVQSPELVRIPAGTPPKAAARIRRNYAFDRARYFLPVTAQTNMMLVMSARGWVGLIQQLLASGLIEGERVAAVMRDELALVTPRLIRHARLVDGIAAGIRSVHDEVSKLAAVPLPTLMSGHGEAKDTAFVQLDVPSDVTDASMASAFAFHDNRYGFVGDALRRTSVRFGWEAVTMAELRDLNRHRTGTKYCPMLPLGFYCALDQVPAGVDSAPLVAWAEQGRKLTLDARQGIAAGNPADIYKTLLGSQYYFEHTTTADKFVYEAELRTGTGAHYKYAKHLHDCLELWYQRFPATRGLVLEGTAEPE
jgi:thymidylate synthase ThyX